jgi:hypothetical protein
LLVLTTPNFIAAYSKPCCYAATAGSAASLPPAISLLTRTECRMRSRENEHRRGRR